MQVNVMSEGHSFGELALINNAPRMATIVTLTPCIFAVLSKQDYKNVIARIQKQQMESEMDKIHRVAGFEKISRRGINMLLYSFKTQIYTMRDFVYNEGEANNRTLYIIRSGQFKVMK
jgi:CRP-like cAMP-binding protein